MPQKGPRDSREHLLLFNKMRAWKFGGNLGKGNSQCESFGLVCVLNKSYKTKSEKKAGGGGEGTFSYAKQITIK